MPAGFFQARPHYSHSFSAPITGICNRSQESVHRSNLLDLPTLDERLSSISYADHEGLCHKCAAPQRIRCVKRRMCMRFVRSWLLAAVALMALAGSATAQTTNGTISGHVSDAQGLALPGVTVNASSPNLQGVRMVVSSEIGDYVIPLLPPGVYTLSFELSGFEKVTKEGTLAPTQTLPIDASLGVAAVAVTVDVVGRTAD